MDDKNKPLKSAINIGKDLNNTYMKNEKKKVITIESVNDPKSDNEVEITSGQNVDANSQADDNQIAFDELNKQINALESENSSLLKERDELRDQLHRKLAEFENFRKRTISEKEELRDYANEKLLFRMLEIIDELSLALESSKTTTDYDSLAKGVTMTFNKTMKIFEDQGVKAMENSEGKEFTVDYHEALMAQPSDLPEGYIVKEFQKGYLIKDKVLRHARVVTSTGSN